MSVDATGGQIVCAIRDGDAFDGRERERHAERGGDAVAVCEPVALRDADGVNHRVAKDAAAREADAKLRGGRGERRQGG